MTAVSWNRTRVSHDGDDPPIHGCRPGGDGSTPRPGASSIEPIRFDPLRWPRTMVAMIDPKTNPGSEEHESIERYDLEVAPRVRNLPAYLFGRINELKYRKRQAGVDVIDLGMGNPTDPPEEWVIDKLCEAARDSRNHRYSVANGVYNLRREVAVRYEKPVRRQPRPRPRGRGHDRVQGRVQPHVPGPAGARRHRPGARPRAFRSTSTLSRWPRPT